jgi:hypothetical protein
MADECASSTLGRWRGMLGGKQESGLTKTPHYSAVLRDWDSNADLGPVDVSTPYREDNDVKAIAIMNAFTWCRENGVDRVRVQIMKDGHSLSVFPVEPNADGT